MKVREKGAVKWHVFLFKWWCYWSLRLFHLGLMPHIIIWDERVLFISNPTSALPWLKTCSVTRQQFCGLVVHYKEPFSPFFQQLYFGQIGLFCVKKQNLFLCQAKEYGSDIHIIHMFSTVSLFQILPQEIKKTQNTDLKIKPGSSFRVSLRPCFEF